MVYHFSKYGTIKEKHMKKLITISGNIGAGKSTYLESFVNYLKDHVKDREIILVEEGIESDKEFQEKLKIYYKYPERRIEFQTYVTEFRHRRIKEYPDDSILVSERGLMDDVVFSNATSLKLENVNGQYITYYYDLLRRLREDYPKVLANIYLRTDPVACHKNIAIRGREEEKDIKLSYVKALHHCHEAFLPMLAEEFDYDLIDFDFNNHTPHDLVSKYALEKIKHKL